MAQRITEAMLEARIKYLNKITNSPADPYTFADGRNRANVGNFHLSHAYGGVCVHRIANESGGVNTPIIYGHVTKRECYNALNTYISGIEFAMQQQGVTS